MGLAPEDLILCVLKYAGKIKYRSDILCLVTQWKFFLTHFFNMKYNACSFAKYPHGKDESVFDACLRLPVAMLPYNYSYIKLR